MATLVIRIGRSRLWLKDPHQVHSIIAAAICDCRKDHPEHAIDPEETKQIARCIVEALSDAGLRIAPVDKG
jgi:hypothetical protein